MPFADAREMYRYLQQKTKFAGKMIHTFLFELKLNAMLAFIDRVKRQEKMKTAHFCRLGNLHYLN